MISPSPACIALVKKWEGCRLTAYRCPEGVVTVAWGHTGHDVAMGQTVTQEQADALLAIDLNSVAHDLSRRCKVELEQHQADALISFGFNCGLGGCPTLFKLLNAGRYDQVPAQLLRFTHGANTGNCLPGLVARRHDEAALFATGTAPAPAPLPEPMPQAVVPRPGQIAPALTGRTVWGSLLAGAGAVISYIGAVPDFIGSAFSGGQSALAPMQPLLDATGMSSGKEWTLLVIVIGVGTVIYARLNAAAEEKIG